MRYILLMKMAFRFSMLERQIGSLIGGVVADVSFPIRVCLASRHCLAITPNRAMFNTSASSA
ncbi:MAG: hypothetical protein LBQ66_09295 [Planctomycetaceae bacterium]|nr:hypothetical protein [Planctomycetaceae bacterium]